MSYVIEIEGQKIPVPDEIGADDARVKQALAPYYPDAANAMITRVEKDGTTIVNVVKRAGTKGGDMALDALIACQGGVNPAVALCQRLGPNPLALPAEELLAFSNQITEAIQDGNAQNDALVRALNRLVSAQPQPAPALIEGF